MHQQDDANAVAGKGNAHPTAPDSGSAQNAAQQIHNNTEVAAISVHPGLNSEAQRNSLNGNGIGELSNARISPGAPSRANAVCVVIATLCINDSINAICSGYGIGARAYSWEKSSLIHDVYEHHGWHTMLANPRHCGGFLLSPPTQTFGSEFRGNQ